ncbi:LuxR C-terminal-related transcriptional regulator [Novosphingobium silvae]|jgi:two-component system nitrate/nitrite response regulator NarL|nr:response regulator transcription factor [Novosphingobium silvae]
MLKALPHGNRREGLITDMPASISVAIRSSIIREGLRRILSDSLFDVSESVSSLEELQLAEHSGGEQHLLVVERDLLRPPLSADLEALASEHPGVRVVVLTSAFTFDEMIAAYSAGVYAYFPDDVPYMSLVAVLQMVSNGQKVASHEAVNYLVSLPSASLRTVDSASASLFNFRERELRVLEFLALGQPNKAISRELGINESSVKAAVKAILRKLGVENRTQAAVMARELISQRRPPTGKTQHDSARASSQASVAAD